MPKNKKTHNILHYIINNINARIVLSFIISYFATTIIVEFSVFGNISNLLIIKKFTVLLSIITGNFIKLIGYKVTINGASIMFSANNGIFFEFGCIAVRQIIMNLFFILFFFGKLQHKIAYILVTSIIIEFVNIQRAIIIALINFHSAQSFNLAHNQLSIWLLHGSILTIWLIWINNNKTNNAIMSY